MPALLVVFFMVWFLLEKFLVHSLVGVEWHTNLQIDQNMITQGDMPRFILDSYEECHGPPRLFTLDKYGNAVFS